MQRLSEELSSSPRQTFVAFPAAVILFELITRRRLRVDPRWLALLPLGYALYRAAGELRQRRGAGARGFADPPRALVTDGPYALSRNPMYLGHLIFLGGLVGATRSRAALLLFLRQYQRFAERISVDEKRLERIFGDDYRAYSARVPRWIGPIRARPAGPAIGGGAPAAIPPPRTTRT